MEFLNRGTEKQEFLKRESFELEFFEAQNLIDAVQAAEYEVRGRLTSVVEMGRVGLQTM